MGLILRAKGTLNPLWRKDVPVIRQSLNGSILGPYLVKVQNSCLAISRFRTLGPKFTFFRYFQNGPKSDEWKYYLYEARANEEAARPGQKGLNKGSLYSTPVLGL